VFISTEQHNILNGATGPQVNFAVCRVRFPAGGASLSLWI